MISGRPEIRFQEEKHERWWSLLDERVHQIVDHLADVIWERYGVAVLITSTIRNAGPHRDKRAADGRTSNLPGASIADKAALADELEAWAQVEIGPCSFQRYVIFEHPDHENPKLRNPEHLHVQVPRKVEE